MIIVGGEKRETGAGYDALLTRELATYEERNMRSRALHEQASTCLIGGVPMQWMSEWAGTFPLFGRSAAGARVEDVDGNSYVDFCLGDTGAMFGHALPQVVRAASEQAARGISLMLPSEEAVAAGSLLQERFGLPYWQFAISATDANRFLLRLAREITARPKILVFNGSYHGTVDETIVSLRQGAPVSRDGNVGPAFNPAMTSRVVEFNDLEAVERELADGQVACVLTEPAMTNIGIVLPRPGFMEGVRDLCNRYGSLLILDETHTMSSGPGGHGRLAGIQSDMLTVGKSIAGGIPSAVYGFSAEMAEKVRARTIASEQLVAGIGGTLSGNWLSVRATRLMLEEVITEDNYIHMRRVTEQLTSDVRDVIARHSLPWHATQLGARMEYRFQPEPPVNGTQAAQGGAPSIDRLIHLYCLNRGVMVTPMHNMLLSSPATTLTDAALHAEVFADCVAEMADNDAL